MLTVLCLSLRWTAQVWCGNRKTQCISAVPGEVPQPTGGKSLHPIYPSLQRVASEAASYTRAFWSTWLAVCSLWGAAGCSQTTHKRYRPWLSRGCLKELWEESAQLLSSPSQPACWRGQRGKEITWSARFNYSSWPRVAVGSAHQ